MYQRILVATNGNRWATTAVNRSAVVARTVDAELSAMSVVDPMPSGVADILGPVGRDTVPQEVRNALETAADTAAEAGVAIDTAVLSGSPAMKIRGYTTDYDVGRTTGGTHGRRGVERTLVGRVAERIVRTARFSVLVVRDEQGENTG